MLPVHVLREHLQFKVPPVETNCIAKHLPDESRHLLNLTQKAYKYTYVFMYVHMC